MSVRGGYTAPEGVARPAIPTTGRAVKSPPSSVSWSPQSTIADLYARRTALKRELAVVEHAIERFLHDWAYTPDTAFEDRGGDRWVRISYRARTKCVVVNERIDENPRDGLGQWNRTAKFREETA